MTRVTHQPAPEPRPEHEGIEEELREYLHVSRSHFDQLARAMRDIGGPAVLETATVTIGATGHHSKSYRVPYAALVISSQTLAGSLTVTSAGPQGSAPGGGQGQIQVGPGGSGSWNIVGTALTIYGPVGAIVTYSVLVARIQPDVAAAAAVALPFGGASITAAGAVTAPGAGAAIATTAAIGTGLYEVTVRAYLTGTPGAGDADNLKLAGGAAAPAVISLPPAVAVAPTPYTVRVRGTGAALAVQAIGAGTAGAIYHVTVTATQIGP